MKSRLLEFVTVGAIAAVILAPAIIWGGKRATDPAAREGAVKLPEVSTIGPELTPYVLTPAEREKLILRVSSPPIPLEYLHEAWPKVELGSKGPYPGMTQAELDKLAAWRACVREGTMDGRSKIVLPTRELPSKFEIVPRAPGIEGMTPAERAKLEAYAKEGGQK